MINSGHLGQPVRVARKHKLVMVSPGVAP